MNTILLVQSSEWWDDTQHCHNDVRKQDIHDFDVGKKKERKITASSKSFWIGDSGESAEIIFIGISLYFPPFFAIKLTQHSY